MSQHWNVSAAGDDSGRTEGLKACKGSLGTHLVNPYRRRCCCSYNCHCRVRECHHEATIESPTDSGMRRALCSVLV